MVLVTYDVPAENPVGTARLRAGRQSLPRFRPAGAISVFEIEVEPAQWTALKAKLEAVMDPKPDSLRYYYLGANCAAPDRACRGPSPPRISAGRSSCDAARTMSVPLPSGSFALA